MYSLDCSCGLGHFPAVVPDLDIQPAGLGGLERVLFWLLDFG